MSLINQTDFATIYYGFLRVMECLRTGQLIESVCAVPCSGALHRKPLSAAGRALSESAKLKCIGTLILYVGPQIIHYPERAPAHA